MFSGPDLDSSFRHFRLGGRLVGASVSCLREASGPEFLSEKEFGTCAEYAYYSLPPGYFNRDLL